MTAPKPSVFYSCPRRTTQLNFDGDFDIVLGDEIPGVIEHFFGSLLSGIFEIVFKSECSGYLSHR